MRRLLPPILIVGLLLGLAAPESCLACSCFIPQPKQTPTGADVIFRGRLIAFSQQQITRYKVGGAKEQVTQLRATFLVDTGWKGPIAPVLSIATGTISGRVVSQSNCDPSFQQGRTYLIFATRGVASRDNSASPLSTSFCAGTRAVEDAGTFLATLGPGTSITQPLAGQGSMGAGLALAAFDLTLSAERSPLSPATLTPSRRAPLVFAK